ncbi:MAG: P-type conjugative transfer protein VirB9 [Planctomycetaceae bacterium]|nr:P-type conjugative transfer protein VirB9 [Planctomycetaceae bacterium]
MKLKTLLLNTAIISCLFMSPALAGKNPRPMTADARIKIVTYHENDVYQVRGHYGYSTVIELSPKERIETISLGDTESWQVMKPGKPNIMFIKPLEEDAATNMTVITDKRMYTFELTASQAYSHRSPDLTFRLKFHYADDAAQELAYIGSVSEAYYNPLEGTDATDLNFDYSYAGSKRLRPIRAFDDGVFTYFQFEDFDVMPAVFAVDENGNERLVNFNVQGKYVVVSGLGSQFTLRDGETATCIFNETFPKPEPEVVNEVIPLAEIEEASEKIILSHTPMPTRKPDIEAIKLAAEEEPSLFKRIFGTAQKIELAQGPTFND